MLCSKSSRMWIFNSSSLPDPSVITNTNFPNKVIRRQQLTHSSYSPPPINFSSESIDHMDSVPKNQEPMSEFLIKKPYFPPSWASRLNPIPSHVFSLGHFPIPIHKWNLPNLPKNTEVCIKRDDLSGMQLSGNKVRKLEFLLADAVAQGADCIITIGGIQSNHCRATAVAAKYLNLDCYLILRTSKVLVDKDPGLTGNLLVERLVGAHIDLVSKEEYAKVGSLAWGYIEAIWEIQEQCQKGNGEVGFDDIVVACGSGGTIAGLSVGSWLGNLGVKVNAYCVCDDPDYFYDYTQGLLDGLQAGVSSRDSVRVKNAKGLGYAMNTSEELKFVRDIAKATGIVLDPVYSGKAAYGMMRDMSEDPKKWEGRKVLFIHTGGLLGFFDKAEEMASLVWNWRRMDIHKSVPRKEGTGSANTWMSMNERIAKRQDELRAAKAARGRGQPVLPVVVQVPSSIYRTIPVPLQVEVFHNMSVQQQMERVTFLEQANQESQACISLLEQEMSQMRLSVQNLKGERDRYLEQARSWEEKHHALKQL